MVAMTAFGARNDYSGVQVVILANTPFDMASVVQQFGRAGRWKTSIMLHNSFKMLTLLTWRTIC